MKGRHFGRIYSQSHQYSHPRVFQAPGKEKCYNSFLLPLESFGKSVRIVLQSKVCLPVWTQQTFSAI